jgi:hypothetical protein
LFLEQLCDAHRDGKLSFYGNHAPLSDRAAFQRHLQPTRRIDWVVYAKRPFAGPESVLRYLSRYTHRIAIANSRLINATLESVTFKWKDDRIKGRKRNKSMILETGEFIRRFLIHVLPSGFHRIRHYGLLSNKARSESLPLARKHLHVVPVPEEQEQPEKSLPVYICRHCGEPMIIIEVFERPYSARGPPVQAMTR